MLALDSLVWRQGADLWLTVVAKASFSFAKGDGPMEPVAPTAIVRAEQHHRGSFTASIRASSDLAPHKGACDVLLVGHAVAAGAPVKEILTRLALLRGEGPAIVDKRVAVRSDAPFSRLPIVFEHAFGGPGFKDNPLGTPTPSVVFAEPERAKEPASYAPVSATWPGRKRSAPPNSSRFFEQPVADLAGFEAAYWQAAPADQRVSELAGDETLVLEGLNANHPRLAALLPSISAIARARLADDPVGEMSMRADTLYVDADAERCDVTWRASVHLPSADLLPWLVVEAGLRVQGEAFAFDRVPMRLEAPRPSAPDLVTLQRTLAMEGEDGPSTVSFVEPGAVSLPFVPVTPRPRESIPEGEIPGAPWSPIQPTGPRGSDLANTLVVEAERPSPKAAILPSEPAAPAPAPPPEKAPEKLAPVVVVAPAPTPPPREAAKPAPKAAPPPRDAPRAAPVVKDLYKKLRG